ncbi:MAG: sulfatase, partial [Phycisphaeraceae bacterium]
MSAPNVLLIITDQQAASAMSCAGNTDLRTPAMDRIAARGMRFDRAYCTQPLCVPSRASLVTGRYPHEVGVPYNLHPSECRDATRVPWIGGVMAEAGYRTAWVGKWHLPVEPERADVHGFAVTREARGNKLDWLVAPHCDELLREDDERPLFLVASFVNPHDCCEAARDQDLPNGPIGEAPPPEQCPALPSNFDPPAREPSALRAKVQPAHPGVYPTVSWDEDRWRQYRWQYNRLVEKVDSHIGEVLDALERSGKLDNTVIIFTSDHGDGMGAHRWNQKQVFYDEVARVPMLVSAPGGRRGAVEQRLVSMNVDLIPTLCDYAGRAAPEDLPGRSLRPLVEGPAPETWRDAVFCETEFSGFGVDSTTGVKGRMVRTERYKYAIYSEGDDREQLFDMQADPGEMRDLSGDDDAAPVLAHHRELLSAWCRRTADAF